MPFLFAQAAYQEQLDVHCPEISRIFTEEYVKPATAVRRFRINEN